MVIGFFIKLISKFFILPLAAILLTISLFSYSASKILTDKSHARAWISDEKVKTDLQKELKTSVENQKKFSLIEYLVGKNELNEFVEENVEQPWDDKQINIITDNLYTWLESNNSERKEIFGIAVPSGFDLIPKVYQTFIGIYNRLFITTGVLILIVFLTAKSFRQGFFLLGIIAFISGGLLYFGPDYIATNPEIVKKVNIWGINFRWFYEIAPVYQRLITLALDDVFNYMNRYAFYLFIGGIISLVATQIAINRIDTGNLNTYGSRYNDLDEDDFEEDEKEVDNSKSSRFEKRINNNEFVRSSTPARRLSNENGNRSRFRKTS